MNMIKWNTLDIAYIKIHTRLNNKTFKQFYVDNREQFQLLLKGATSHQRRGLPWSLGDCSCWKRTRVLLVLLFTNQNPVFSHCTHLKVLKNLKKSKGKKRYLWLVGKLHPCSSPDLPCETRYRPNRTPGTRLCPWLVRLHLKLLHLASAKSLFGWA